MGAKMSEAGKAGCLPRQAVAVKATGTSKKRLQTDTSSKPEKAPKHITAARTACSTAVKAARQQYVLWVEGCLPEVVLQLEDNLVGRTR